MDVSEIMILCYEEPDMVHTVMEKVTDFLIAYCRAYEQAGANGVMIAEPGRFTVSRVGPGICPSLCGPADQSCAARGICGVLS